MRNWARTSGLPTRGFKANLTIAANPAVSLRKGFAMATPKTPEIKFVDNPSAPEFYASGATGFFVSNGTITITLESIRADHGEKPGPLQRVVVGRLTMPAAGAQGLAIGLFDFLEKQGFKYDKPAT
jgi:hypothetical protein